jgi:hypothetical protein
VSAGAVAVHDVVVQEGEVVDQLHGAGRVHDLRLLALRSGRLGAEHGQGRAQRLAGAGRVVPAEVVAGDRAQRRMQAVHVLGKGRID